MKNVGGMKGRLLRRVWPVPVSAHRLPTRSPIGPLVRIALITRRYPPLIGGAEKVLSYLAPALAAEGAEVTVLTSRAEGLPEGEDVPTPRGSLAVVRLETSRLRFVGTWLYMRNLRRWLERHPVDLAYVSMMKHDAYVAVGVGRRRGFPVVLRPEGAGATGDVAWQSWGRFGRAIARRCRRADAVVAISRAVRDELRGAGYDRTAEVVELPNGVPMPADPWRRREGWREAPRAVFVGRLAPEKNLKTLIRSWPIVLRDRPGARLTLVGEGPERPGLEALVAEQGLKNAVELSGAVPDPTPLLREADLFVLPSHEEGMSIALLEAMALGMPLVASAIPGNRRLISDFKHGRLAAPGESDALARAILEQWAEYDRAVHMGRAARALVEQKYSIAAVARRHLELFRKLVEAKGRPGGAPLG
jgi:glycosyltransferase involved in cell wall biosynthesis